jgi:hypothetical protein
MRITRTPFLILCSAALFATLSLTAQGPPAAGKGKAKGKGPPGANHPDRIQVPDHHWTEPARLARHHAIHEKDSGRYGEV